MWTGIRDVRVATYLQVCVELRSDSGIHGISLKLLGPFPLWPGLMKHETKHVHVLPWRRGAWSWMWSGCGSLVVTHIVWAFSYCQNHLVEFGAGWAGDENGSCLENQLHVNQSRNCLKRWSSWENTLSIYELTSWQYWVPIHEHEISIYLFFDFFHQGFVVFFIQILYSFVKSIPKSFILGGANEYGIVF